MHVAFIAQEYAKVKGSSVLDCPHNVREHRRGRCVRCKCEKNAEQVVDSIDTVRNVKACYNFGRPSKGERIANIIQLGI